MGFFNRILGGGADSSGSNNRWNLLETEQELEDVVMASNDRSQIILKHSNSCGVSFFAKRNLDSISSEEIESVDFSIIDVVRNRPTSLYLADKFKIRHESPQLFIIKDGEVVWHGSHSNVNRLNLLNAI